MKGLGGVGKFIWLVVGNWGIFIVNVIYIVKVFSFIIRFWICGFFLYKGICCWERIVCFFLVERRVIILE